MMAKLSIRGLNFAYGQVGGAAGGTAPTRPPVLRDLNLDFEAGQIALICGATGSGKSTLLKCINGLAPAFTGGVLGGQVLIDGQDVSRLGTRGLVGTIGYVNQQPDRGFVAQTVRDELVFGMEQLGFSRTEMNDRLAETCERLQLDALLERETGNLSGGEQQRVAIGAALAAGQRILLLDEPTSALDAQAAEATMQVLRSLADASGLTILLVEHRLERVLPWVDSVTVVHGDGSASMRPIADAAAELLAEPRIQPGDSRSLERTESVASFDSLVEGEILAIMGRNGSGKSTLLWRLQAETDAIFVPQQASDLLFLHTVSAELDEADRFAEAKPGSAAQILQSLVGDVDLGLHPRDLSAGSQLALALAVQLVREGNTILLDEPTRGLDYAAKRELASMLQRLNANGKTIAVASHDFEFLAAICDRVIDLDRDPSEVNE